MIPYIIVKDIGFATTILTELVDKDKPVFMDIETENLYYGVRLIQLYQPELHMVYILDLDYMDLETIKGLIKPLWTMWAGANYDFGTLNMVTDKYDDIQLLARTAFWQLGQYDMEYLADKLIPNSMELYVGIDKKAMQKQGFKLGTELTDEQLRYSADDVVALEYLWRLPQIQQTRELLFYKVDMLSLRYSTAFQQNGAVVDTNAVREEIVKCEQGIERTNQLLDGVNSKSYKQIRAYLSRLMGVEVIKSDGDYLIELMTENDGRIAEFAKACYDNSRLRLRLKNLEKLDKDKIYTKFNPYGTVTGRYSSKGKFGKDADKNPEGINFQNVTRNLQYLLLQPTEDTVVVHADYGTAELRSACSLMGDNAMREHILAGTDLHRVSAMMADPTIKDAKDVTKEQRTAGKSINFGFIFGMSANRFGAYAYSNYGVQFSDLEAKKVRDKYLFTYKAIAKYHQDRWRDYKTEPVKSPMGRKNKPRLGTDAINFSTQSAIGETCKLAIHYLCKEYPDATKYLFSQVHDAIYLRVSKEDGYEWGRRLGVAMLRAWDEILKLDDFKFKDIPMEIELEVGEDVIETTSIKEMSQWKIK